MFAFFGDLAQVARIELEGHVPGFTRSEVDTREAFECAEGSAGRLWIFEVKFRNLIATYP
jgi:hypothetical protein